MNNSLLTMQIGAQRRVLGWLPELAARRDTRLIVGMGLAGSALVNPATAAAGNGPTGPGGGAPQGPAAASSTTNSTACRSGAVNHIISFIDYGTKALIAVIGAVVLFRFAMAAWTMVASNKANRGKKAMNDMMWVGAGFVIVILIFPLRAGIVEVVKALFPPDTTGGAATAPAGGLTGGGNGELSSCATQSASTAPTHP